MQHPTVRSVNILYLIVMILLSVGSILLAFIVPATYPATLVRELVFILLPALVYLYLRKLPFKETVRFQWPGLTIAVLGFAIGLGVWMVDAWLASLITGILQYSGYEMPIPPDFYPQSLGDMVIIFLVLAVAAPLCEELLFRGIIQRGYEHHGAWRAIVLSGLMFVLFHQSLVQGIAIIPLAMVLGYLAWRTQSLIPSILAHFANNLMAVLVLSSTIHDIPLLEQLVTLPWLPLIGAALAAVGLWILVRASQIPDEELAGESTSWLMRAWPACLAILIWLFMVGMESLVSFSPQVMASGTLPAEYESAPWQTEQRWRYEIRARDNSPIGEADCTLTPDGPSVLLECTMSHSAYDVTVGNSQWLGVEAAQRHTIRWNSETMKIEEAHVEGVFNEDAYEINLKADASGLAARGKGPDGRFSANGLPVDSVLTGGGVESSLMIGEWPWRFSTLPFELLYGHQVPTLQFMLMGTDEESLVNSPLIVRTSEPLNTPAGDFVTWRVSFGKRWKAWYDINAPHTLVGFDDGMVTWLLVEQSG